MQQGQESVFERLGKALRVRLDDTTHEPLPRRWVDLILHLEEQERRDVERQLEHKIRSLPQTVMTTAPDMALVADEDLQRLAEENGPASAEAQALAQLKSQRSQDLQVHCYRVNDTYVTGPLPDATEPASPDGEFMEALKRAQSE